MYQKQIIGRIQEQESRPHQSGAALCSKRNDVALRHGLLFGVQHDFSVLDLVVEVYNVCFTAAGRNVDA